MDEHLEHLINRKLDGELTDTEARVLEERLAGNEAARRQLVEAQRMDDLVSAVVREACTAGGASLDPPSHQLQSWPRWFGFAAVPTALAACVALWFVWLAVQQPAADLSNPDQAAPPPAGIEGRFANDTRLRPLPPWDGPASDSQNVRFADWAQGADLRNPYQSSSTKIDYFGVFDEAAGKLFLLEVQRNDHAVYRPNRGVPPQQGRVVLTSGEM